MEHTFTTGRTIEMRDSLPTHVLIRRAVNSGQPDILTRLMEMQEGRLDDAEAALRIQDAIVETMWMAPRVVQLGVDPQDGEVSIEDLTDEELSETLDVALGGVADAASFRGDGGGLEDGADSPDVGAKPKPRTRAKAGKR